MSGTCPTIKVTEPSDDSSSDDDESHDVTMTGGTGGSGGVSANLRTSLKIVRDPTKNAFDILPTGETIGAFANRQAIERYARKVESKRERARETRRQKRKHIKSQQKKKESRLSYGDPIPAGTCAALKTTF